MTDKKRCCICCPGAGLLDADWDKLPEIRIAINDAATIVPDWTHFVMVDPDSEKLTAYDSGYVDGKPRIVCKWIYEYPGNTFHGDCVPVECTPIGSFDLAVYYATKSGYDEITVVGSDANGTRFREPANAFVDNYQEWCTRIIERVKKIADEAGANIIFI